MNQSNPETRSEPSEPPFGASSDARLKASWEIGPGTRHNAVLEVLARSQSLGFIGGDLGDHVAHAEGFMAAIGGSFAGRALDLGSGGGLPGLVLAALWPESSWVLLDAIEKRTSYLREAVRTLGWADQITVIHDRAEDAARKPELRAAFDLVVSRSFGSPAVVAECAAGFLRVGGRVVVSEPPGTSGERWDHGEELALMGLRPQGFVAGVGGGPSPGGSSGYHVLAQEEACPERYPRRAGMPSKRPLF